MKKRDREPTKRASTEKNRTMKTVGFMTAIITIIMSAASVAATGLLLPAKIGRWPATAAAIFSTAVITLATAAICNAYDLTTEPLTEKEAQRKLIIAWALVLAMAILIACAYWIL